MARIQLLDERVANQIAAGEVIERPASIVKELIENSLDSNAEHIQVQVEAGALRRIRLTDDGEGIDKDDLELAFQRHATSKIRDATDLSCVATMGFRGEALASISAVARVELTTRTAAGDSAWTIRVEGGKQTRFAPAAGKVGTVIDVTDLFYNTPARRKFLKQPRTEMNHVANVVRVLAATHPHCSFELTNDGRVVESLEAVESMEDRVARILGRTFMEESIEIDLERDDMRLSGWVGIPTHTRASANRQYFYVNGRHVRDRIVAHAIKQGYKDVMFQRPPSSFSSASHAGSRQCGRERGIPPRARYGSATAGLCTTSSWAACTINCVTQARASRLELKLSLDQGLLDR